MNLAIIKYNAGNIQSVLYALERLGVQAVVTDKTEEILSADKVIFPCMLRFHCSYHDVCARQMPQYSN